MTWQPEIEEMGRRRDFVQQMGGEERVQRHHDSGKYTVRERIEKLLDPGSFREVGTFVGVGEYGEGNELTGFRPANFVMGHGKISGRPVVVGGDDFTVRGGAAAGAIGGKMVWTDRTARELRIPSVRLIDGSGGGGSVGSKDTSGAGQTTSRMFGPTYVWEDIVPMLGEVPVIGAVMGSVAGLGAIRAVASHWTVMPRKTGQIFVAGPPIVERGIGQAIPKEELGGYQVHTRGSGVIDNEAEDEDDLFAQVRRFLSYLPLNAWEKPPVASPSDDPGRRDEWLLGAVPRDRKRVYDARRILRAVLDRGSIFELTPYYGRPLITSLARVDGYPVGVLCNDPYHYGGGLNAAASEKGVRFIDLCDTFNIPIVNIMDQPGYAIGLDAERSGILRAGTRYGFAVDQSTVPWITVLVRRAYGVATTAWKGTKLGWPSGDWGGLPIEGGVQAVFRREIDAAPDPAARRREIEDALYAGRSPFQAAENFTVHEIIDPRDTRARLVEWVPLAYESMKDLGPKGRTFRP
ncbi:MAG: methylmalonyl-CoA carboxyltransferase [Dehalococcoidia bacterium]|nr:methylmalonyl-CoA carboxyltransferase [Dehalococcoidia bacterium]